MLNIIQDDRLLELATQLAKTEFANEDAPSGEVLNHYTEIVAGRKGALPPRVLDSHERTLGYINLGMNRVYVVCLWARDRNGRAYYESRAHVARLVDIVTFFFNDQFVRRRSLFATSPEYAKGLLTKYSVTLMPILEAMRARLSELKLLSDTKVSKEKRARMSHEKVSLAFQYLSAAMQRQEEQLKRIDAQLQKTSEALEKITLVLTTLVEQNRPKSGI